MERVKYNGTIKPNLATNSSARSFIVSVDPNSNNAASWDRGYHFNDVNTVAPVHSNGLTSAKTPGAGNNYGILNYYTWNATHNNTWTLNEFAHQTIDPYDFHGSPYDPVKTVDLVIKPGSSSNVQALGPGYAGYNSSTSWAYFLQSAGNPGAYWARRTFSTTPYYMSNLLDPVSTNFTSTDVSPVIPKSQELHMDSLSFSDSITSSSTVTTSVSRYSVVPNTSYTVPNVILSPFRMTLAFLKQGTQAYCYIPLHVITGSTFTFQKNPSRFELASNVTFTAYLDRECLRACQNYLKDCISLGTVDGSTKNYFPYLEWETRWRFATLPGGTSEASLSSDGHTSKFRIAWSGNNFNSYKVSNIEQIQ